MSRGNVAERFAKWLKERGADVLSPTNEYEVMRWRANGITSVVYQGKRGQISGFVGEGETAYEAWRRGRHYEVSTTRRKKLGGQIQTIVDRDGEECFFCGKPFESPDDMTVEHLVPLSAGGPNHSSNMAIVHQECNNMAGSKSVAEKVRLRDELRGFK